jgi:hypothetical protein
VEILRRELVGFPWMSHNVWATYVCVCKIIYIYLSLSVCVQNYIAVYWVQFTNWKEASGMIPLTIEAPFRGHKVTQDTFKKRIFVPRAQCI